MNLWVLFNDKLDSKTISVYYSSCENVCSLMQLVVQLLFGQYSEKGLFHKIVFALSIEKKKKNEKKHTI